MRSVPLFLPLAALAAAPLAAQAPALRVRVLDSRTGEALAARALGGASSAFAEGDGRLTLAATAAAAGPFTLFAPGHRPLTVSLGGNDPALPVTVWLDPLEEIAAPPLPREGGLLEGFVTDEASGRPLAGARAALEGREAVTGADGRFALPYRPREKPGEPPGGAVLRVGKPGYRAQRVDDFPLAAGARRALIALAPGAGETVRSERHKLTLDCATLADAQSAPAPGEPPAAPAAPFFAAADAGWDGFRPVISPALVAINPPSTIKVGTSCSCTTCSAVDVISLETYVQRGLDDEWIASWNTQSLRAGSVAYRSYGSYYALHPLNASYDICSSTCCQVYNTTTSASTTAAAAATPGILLQRAGAVARSEFSAENNSWKDPNSTLSCTNSDLSCGDGNAGSPAAGWPCLSDSVCAGHTCFGHGRGMCQWGTQRWATAATPKLWNWITDHYYNANNAPAGSRAAFMTTPITLGALSPSPATIGAGQSFTINLAATNAAGLPHNRILIGASLYSTATGYLSDPAHDALTVMPVGAGNYSRTFTVPLTAPDGSYDLIVALWLDTDENGVITGADLPLTSATAAGALTVQTASPGRVGTGGAPLTAGKSGSSLVFSWGKPCASAIDYSVYEGTLGNFTSHLPLSCSTGGATSATLAPGAGNRYYLVVPMTATHEGSYGTNSAGVETPPSAAACRAAQHLVPLCR